MMNKQYKIKMIDETDKAIKVALSVEVCGKRKNIKRYLPKSQIQYKAISNDYIIIELPDWLEKKNFIIDGIYILEDRCISHKRYEGCDNCTQPHYLGCDCCEYVDGVETGNAIDFN